MLTSKSKLTLLHYVTAHLESEDPAYLDLMRDKFGMSMFGENGKLVRVRKGSSATLKRTIKKFQRVVPKCQHCSLNFNSFTELHKHCDSEVSSPFPLWLDP